jgi:hypothetical protein
MEEFYVQKYEMLLKGDSKRQTEKEEEQAEKLLMGMGISDDLLK